MLMCYRGVYVDHNERWPEHFRGIGIRIEDSVCVQEDGPLVLTTEAVKEVRDHQSLMIPFTNLSTRLWILRLLGGSMASEVQFVPSPWTTRSRVVSSHGRDYDLATCIAVG